jgi:hypothetical protein
MKLVKIALLAGLMTLSVTALALASGNKPETVPPTNTPVGEPQYEPQGPPNGLPEQAKAYGRRCQGESKKHEKGVKGTPFSNCVHNLKQAHNNPDMAPGRVCKGESKKHEAHGEKGTAFSRCVHNVVQQRREERRQEHEEEHQESNS